MGIEMSPCKKIENGSCAQFNTIVVELAETA